MLLVWSSGSLHLLPSYWGRMVSLYVLLEVVLLLLVNQYSGPHHHMLLNSVHRHVVVGSK